MDIKLIKLGQLSKNALRDDQIKHLKGGEYYCDWGYENKKANEDQGKCSCYCADTTAYYDTNTGIKVWGDFIRANWDNDYS